MLLSRTSVHHRHQDNADSHRTPIFPPLLTRQHARTERPFFFRNAPLLFSLSRPPRQSSQSALPVSVKYSTVPPHPISRQRQCLILFHTPERTKTSLQILSTLKKISHQKVRLLGDQKKSASLSKKADTRCDELIFATLGLKSTLFAMWFANGFAKPDLSFFLVEVSFPSWSNP